MGTLRYRPGKSISSVRQRRRRLAFPPGPPTGFALDGPASSDFVDLLWANPTSAGSSPRTDTNIYLRVNNTPPYVLRASAGDPSATTIEITGLTPSTTYNAYAVAVNSVGESVPSNILTFTTTA